MTPKSSLVKKARRQDERGGSNVLHARSLQQELGSETARRVRKSMDHFISTGPPMLKEHEDQQSFFKWQTAMKTFVGKLPGYLPGMLDKKPDYHSMSGKEQGRLRDIYTNIHSWLTKAVSLNSRVSSKTKNIRTHPYPDLVKWWRTVHDLFSCSSTDLSRRKAKLHDHYQFDNEMCVPCFNRFELRVTELEEMGSDMDDHQNGVIFFNGMVPANKRVVQNFMAQMDLDYTLTNMFAVCKWLDELDEEANPNKKRDPKHSANLVTETPPSSGGDNGDSRKRSRSPYPSMSGSTDGNAFKKQNVYFDRDRRSSTGASPSSGYTHSRDRSRSRGRDGRGRSEDRGRSRGSQESSQKNFNPYEPRSGASSLPPNVKITIPGATNPHLSFEMSPDGIMGYYWKGVKLLFTGTYDDVLAKCTRMTSHAGKQDTRRPRDTESRRSNSIDARKIDERLSHAANMVYDSNPLISSFTYYMSLSEMIVILSPLLPNLVCYFDNFEELTGFPDYMGAFFKLRENNMRGRTSWDTIPFPTASYLDLVRTHAVKDVIACPVTSTTTIPTSTTSTASSSSISVTGSAYTVDLQAAIRQLQLLQENPSLMNTMDDNVRKLVLSLSAPSQSSTVETPSAASTIEPVNELPNPPSTSREADRHAYLQEKNRRNHQETLRQKNLTKGTSYNTQPNKRKTICLGLDTQRALSNPHAKSRNTSASSKASSTKTVADKLARKPSDEKWTAEMNRVEAAPVPTPVTDSPNAPVRSRGERNLRQAPKRTDAYSPTAAAAKEQWDRKPIYYPPAGSDYYDIGPWGSPLTPPSPPGITQQERVDLLQARWEGPTVQNVTAAHTDTDDVNVLSDSGETRRGVPPVECLDITQEPPTSRIPLLKE